MKSNFLSVFQRGRRDYRDAVNYFGTRTLHDFSNGDWTNDARYNLARALEASGRADLAVELYQANVFSPGYLGALLREN